MLSSQYLDDEDACSSGGGVSFTYSTSLTWRGNPILGLVTASADFVVLWMEFVSVGAAPMEHGILRVVGGVCRSRRFWPLAFVCV